MSTLDQAIDPSLARVDPSAFSRERYDHETEQVFRRCWLMVGHESLIPNKGDFFSSYMAEDPVIVQRDQTGKVRVFLNRCRHRGNALCVHDRGNAPNFICSYHGWTYADGQLVGVPNLRDAYHNELDKSAMSLVEARSQVYGGLIFACWDTNAISLETYLGEARWWLDNFLLREELGGLEMLPGQQRYVVPTNWKLPVENLAGDYYHFATTHGSVLGALAKSTDKRIAATGATTNKADQPQYYSVAVNHGQGAAHGFFEVSAGDAPRNQEMAIGKQLGPEALEWYHERERILAERLKNLPYRPYSFHSGNIFPNFSMIGVGSAFYGKGLIVHHPRGPERTEAWVWCAVEKNAPDVVKKQQRFVLTQRQTAAGLVAPDDHENFERMGETLATGVARHIPYNYDMGEKYEEVDPRPAQWHGKSPWPGRAAPRISEVIQRDFYRYWGDLMGNER